MFTPTRHRLTALAIILVAAFAGTIAFWGPTLDLGFGDTEAYQWTARNWALYVIPAGAAALGGLFMLLPRYARLAKFGAFLVLAGGLWLLVGPLFSEYLQIETVTLSADSTLATLLYHVAPGFLLTAFAGYGIGISTWARRWHLHKEETITGARDHAKRETARETLRREMDDDAARDDAAHDDESQDADVEHTAVDHREDRQRELVS
ncbi:MAG: hypothetical protein R3343_11875 [Nitriliruptorales bacterium]|nr:hypothetical protein [Nitriliruptorales bacterium]